MCFPVAHDCPPFTSPAWTGGTGRSSSASAFGSLFLVGFVSMVASCKGDELFGPRKDAVMIADTCHRRSGVNHSRLDRRTQLLMPGNTLTKHGGRQVDGSVAAIDALVAVVDAVPM